MTTTTTERPAPGSGSSRVRPPAAWRQLREFFAGRPTYWYDRMALAVLALAAAVLSVWNLTGAMPYMNDEGTYTAQAFSVLQGELAPYTYRYDHPPLGWIQLGALAWLPEVLGLGGGTYMGAARFAMAPFFVATAVLIYLLARRLGVRWPFAALAVTAFIVSPLSLVYGRQVYLDNIGVPWLLLAFYLALSPRMALWHHISAGVFFAVAVLSKETLAIFGPALLLALVNRPAWSNRAFSVVGFLVVGGIAMIFYPLTALLRGELLPGEDHVSLQEGLVYQFLSRPDSGALWNANSSRSELLNGWLYYDQYLIGAGVIAALVCLLQRRTVWITAALATFAVPVLFNVGYLPAMYVVGALPFLALALGAGLNLLWELLEDHAATLRAHERNWAVGYGATCIAVVLILASVLQWFGPGRSVMTQEANQDWAATLEWTRENIPEDATTLAPYVLWQDLNAAGANDPWTVVATEKADLDPQFLVQHPDGWEEIEWIVVGPSTRELVEQHGLTMAATALENSVPVKTIGDWSVHRVQNG